MKSDHSSQQHQSDLSYIYLYIYMLTGFSFSLVMEQGVTMKSESFDAHERESGAESQEFLTFCSSDVQSNTQLVAFCGTNDYNDNSSPETDEWSLSDPYLFLHPVL